MLKLENLCNKISNYISQELNLDDNRKAIINYGIFAFMQMIICILLVMIFGAIFNVFFEAIIVSFTVSILRKSSGGVHASSPKACAVIGTISSIWMAKISQNIQVDFNRLIIWGIIIFIWAYYFIYKLAPVDSVAKPIKNLDKRKRLKKNSIIILSTYLIIIIINFTYLYFIKNESALIYISCIYMGILWQVFSLTKSGHLLLGKLDKLF
jgi:Membrane protein putatively involved in post-translational modification of the autoinducing quorum-sensing peptide